MKTTGNHPDSVHHGAAHFPNVEEMPGKVQVSVMPAASSAEVWDAITMPGIIQQWFGELSGPMQQDDTVRLDFGDGDFFTIMDIQTDQPNLLQYKWRFMGTGPLNWIRWTIRPQMNGCLVTVTDSQPERSPEEIGILQEGWQDFTERLMTFLNTGKPSRYDWRREFDASIEHAGVPEEVWAVLFQPDRLSHWLPVNKAPLKPGALFIPNDGKVPAVFNVLDVVEDRSEYSVAFKLTHPGWLQPTSCQLQVSPYQGHSVLCLSHIGWEAIDREMEFQLQQRRRFSKIWVAALTRSLEVTQFNSEMLGQNDFRIDTKYIAVIHSCLREDQ